MHETRVGDLAQAEYTPDDRSKAYKKIADVLAHVAEQCGVTIDEATYTRWQQAGSLMREFDTFADELPLGGSVDPMYAFRDFTFFAPRYPALTQEQVGSKTFHLMVKNVGRILEIGKGFAVTTDKKEYIELRKAEAYYTTKTFMDLATPEVRLQESFNEFRYHATSLGVAANMGDSLLDLRKDYRSGKTQLAPRADIYIDLAYDMARFGKRSVKYILDREGIAIRAKMLGERAVNRATHILHGEGIPDYSNLRLLIPGRKKRLTTLQLIYTIIV